MFDIATEVVLITIMVICIVLLILSFVFGDFLDILDVDVESAGPFSGRSILAFIIFFCAASYFSVNGDLAWWWTMVIGSLSGLAGAVVVHLVMVGLTKQSGSSHWHIEEAVGKSGVLLVGIEPGQQGRVRLEMKGELTTYGARSQNGGAIPANSSVQIVGTQGGVLIVQAS